MKLRHFEIGIFVIAILARFLVAFWAYEANDNHSEVVLIILEKDQYPNAKDCWECFQPPLFYQVHAFIAQVFDNQTTISIHRQMQWLNFLFAVFCLFVYRRFLADLNLKPPLYLALLAFILWQPRLLGMSVQATNDSAMLLIGALCTMILLRTSRDKQWYPIIWAMLLAGLAAIIKGNGILLLISIPIASLIYWDDLQKEYRWMRTLFFASVLVGCTYLGGYIDKYQEFNNPFITNMEKASPPPFWQDQEWFGKRAGIRSIKSGYLKFPFTSLMETPYQINDEPEFPIHRTNFWTLLYANFYHVQFHNHPWTWRMDFFPWVNNVARALFVLGLLPLLLLLTGFVRAFYNSVGALFKRGRAAHIKEQQLHLALVLLFVVFVLKYSYDYRDFGNIKPLFLFPAFLSFVYLFQYGISTINHKTKRPTQWLIIWLWLVNLLFLLDTTGLIQTLQYHYSLL